MGTSLFLLASVCEPYSQTNVVNLLPAMAVGAAICGTAVAAASGSASDLLGLGRDHKASISIGCKASTGSCDSSPARRPADASRQ